MKPTPLEDRRANTYRAWREGQTDSLRPPSSFARPPQSSRLLMIVAIVAAIALFVLIASYALSVPPAHLLIIAFALLCALGWLFGKKKERP
jgi:Flp pilus assembly protein TadB